MSVAIANGPSIDKAVSPVPLLVDSEHPEAYLAVKYEDYIKSQQSKPLDGRSCLDRVRLPPTKRCVNPRVNKFHLERSWVYYQIDHLRKAPMCGSSKAWSLQTSLWKELSLSSDWLLEISLNKIWWKVYVLLWSWIQEPGGKSFNITTKFPRWWLFWSKWIWSEL